jgi:hypothetical protein
MNHVANELRGKELSISVFDLDFSLLVVTDKTLLARFFDVTLERNKVNKRQSYFLIVAN